MFIFKKLLIVKYVSNFCTKFPGFFGLCFINIKRTSNKWLKDFFLKTQ